MAASDEPLEVRGFNHVSLVCSDMRRTVDFYNGILGFPIAKTQELPNGMGKQVFFDIGVGTGPQLSFFWFADGPVAAPGVASPSMFPDQLGGFATAVGSMNHVAFDVPPERLVEYRQRLKAHGMRVTKIIHHDDSPSRYTYEPHADVLVRSIYFFDPDGILLELASWVRALTDEDVVRPSLKEDEPATPAFEVYRASERGEGKADIDAPFM